MKNSLKRLLFILVMMPIVALAQSTVTGTVTEATNGLPLPDVNVSVKGTNNGASTDFDGNYSISNVNTGDILVFSSLGYAIQEIPYAGTPINVILTEDANSIEAVVLIGYGSAKKENLTGSVDTVGEDEFNKGAIVSPAQLIAGKSAGVNVIQNGGNPGSGPTIRVRPGSTLAGNADPLYVVDGIPLDQRNANLNTINPNEIESFSILKDASATAIYGSRASNGVVIITTKKGKRNKKLAIEYDMQFSVANLIEQNDILTADEFRDFIANNGGDVSLLGNSRTNWQDEIYNSGSGTIQNITATKGWKNTTVRANLNHVNQDGILETSGYRKNGINLNVTQSLLDNDLKLTLSSQNAWESIFRADQGAIGAANVFDPTQAITDANGFAGFFEFADAAGPIGLAPRNPVGLLRTFSGRTENKQFRTNLNVDYRTPVEGLKVVVNAGLDYNEYSSRDIRDGASATRFFQGSIDDQSSGNGFRRNQLLDFYANYKREIEPIKTEFDLTVGHAFQEWFRRDNSRFFNDATSSFTTRRPGIQRNSLETYFARATLTHNDMVILNLNYSRDGSSRFAPENRWGNFYGAALALRLDNLDFIKNSKTISALKLRGGYGVTGQQDIGVNYGYLGLYTPSGPQAQIQFGNEFISTLRPEEYDENLKWEEQKQLNLGLDFGLWNDRVTGSIDAYTRDTDDLLVTIPTPAGSNLSDFLTTNSGSIRSRGIEFGLNTTPVETKDWNLTVGANVTFNEIEVTSLNLSDDPNFEIPVGGIAGGVGNTIQVQSIGYDPTTFSVFKQAYDINGNPLEGVYVDINDDNIINDEDKIKKGKATPDAFVGFTSNLTYKKWDFYMAWRGAFGGEVYNNFQSNTGFISNFTNTPGAFYQNGSTDVLSTGFNNAQLFSDRYVQSADWVKLDNISLGYTVPGDIVDIRASLTATNVFILSDYDGLDPEVNGGIDNNLYPNPRTIIFGLNFKFK